MAIERKEFFNLMHYEYGEAYFGSYKGMRYRLAREPLENVKFVPVDQRGPATLMATVWPEPYSYGKTDKSLMTSENFEVSEDGFTKVKRFNSECKSKICFLLIIVIHFYVDECALYVCEWYACIF